METSYNNRELLKQDSRDETQLNEAISNMEDQPNLEGIRIGLDLLRERKFVEAAERLDQEITTNKQPFKAYNLKGVALQQLNRHFEAILCYNEAINADPTFRDGYFNKGICHLELGEYENAVGSFVKVIQIDKNYMLAYYWKGLSLHENNQNLQAVEVFNQAILINDTYIPSWTTKGHCLFELGNYEEAFLAYNEALKRDNKWIEAITGKGNVLTKLERYNEAIEQFSMALTIQPNYLMAHADIAQTLFLKCEDSQGLAHLKIAQELLQHKQSLSQHQRNLVQTTIENVIKFETEFNEAMKPMKEMLETFEGQPEYQTMLQQLKEKANQFQQKKILLYNQEFDTMKKITPKTLKNYKARQPQQEPFMELSQLKSTRGYSIEKKSQDENITFYETATKKDLILEILKQQQIFQERQLKLAAEIDSLKNQLQDQKIIVDKLDDAAKVTGLYNEAKITQLWIDQKTNDRELYYYTRTFYWILANYFDACRIAQTDLFKSNPEALQRKKEKYMVSALSVAEKIAEKLPVVGGIIGAISDKISQIYAQYNQRRYERRIEGILTIIMQNEDPDAMTSVAQSRMIAFAAIDIADRKKQELLRPTSNRKGSKIERQFQQIRKEAKGEEIDLINNPQGQQALEDVLLLVIYLEENSKEIVRRTQQNLRLSQILSDAVVNRTILEMEKKLNIEDPLDGNKDPNCCLKCSIM